MRQFRCEIILACDNLAKIKAWISSYVQSPIAKMNKFTIRTSEEAGVFQEYLNKYSKQYNWGANLPEHYLEKILTSSNKHPAGNKLFYAIVDLELIFFFMAGNTMHASSQHNSSFSPGKLEGGSILDSYDKFKGKLNILDNLNSFTYRCRSFWDKYLGILFLVYDYENYENFAKAKSRKKAFRKYGGQWSNISPILQKAAIHEFQQTEKHEKLCQQFESGSLFPEPYISILESRLLNLDNFYRTPETHGTGSLKKWSLSMLPIQESFDFGLINHWNSANNYIRALREALLEIQSRGHCT